MKTILALVAVAAVGAWGVALADQPTVSVRGLPAGQDSQDSTITIRKADPARLEPDYRIESGEEEISGEPVAGQDESYKSWKAACNDWKKEMREMNGKSLVTLNCGTPHPKRDKSMRVTQTSTGSYKLKVRIRDTDVAGPSGAN
jgi:hypothetical protein